MLWINKLNLVSAAVAAFEDENAQIIGNLIMGKKKEMCDSQAGVISNLPVLSNSPFYTSQVSPSPPEFVAAKRSQMETQ